MCNTSGEAEALLICPTLGVTPLLTVISTPPLLLDDVGGFRRGRGGICDPRVCDRRADVGIGGGRVGGDGSRVCSSCSSTYSNLYFCCCLWLIYTA